MIRAEAQLPGVVIAEVADHVTQQKVASVDAFPTVGVFGVGEPTATA